MANDLLTTRFARLFDDAFQAGEPSRSFSPAVDIHEREDAFVLELDVPGFRQEDVEVEYHESKLNVASKREFTVEENSKQHLGERRAGSFQRVFTIPRDVDVELISAQSEHGVLTVVLPKSDRAKPRKISISTN